MSRYQFNASVSWNPCINKILTISYYPSINYQHMVPTYTSVNSPDELERISKYTTHTQMDIPISAFNQVLIDFQGNCSTSKAFSHAEAL